MLKPVNALIAYREKEEDTKNESNMPDRIVHGHKDN
jgi:hypothetical protein